MAVNIEYLNIIFSIVILASQNVAYRQISWMNTGVSQCIAPVLIIRYYNFERASFINDIYIYIPNEICSFLQKWVFTGFCDRRENI